MTAAEVLGPIGAIGDHAVEYARAGWEVFPVEPHHKTPYGKHAIIGSQYDATTNVEVVQRCWQQHPDALIGHRLAAGHLLTDIDPRYGGHDTWRELQAKHGARPATRTHVSGRGDGGGHLWWTVELEADEHYSVKGLTEWAKAHGVGTAVDGFEDRWSSGIDLLHQFHRYTILPPSPHPDTGKPYRWSNGRDAEVARIPSWLRELVVVRREAPAPRAPLVGAEGDSIIDWFNATRRFADLLKGWTLIKGSGDDDGSLWRHPSATAAHSASVRDGCLYVHSPNTPFEPTEPNSPHGYDHFDVYAVLNHHGDRSAAARAARELKDGVRPPAVELEQLIADQGEKEREQTSETLPTGPIPVDWAEFWGRERSEIEWVCYPVLPRGRQAAIWAIHKTGKSLFTLDIAAACATGRSVLGQQPAPPLNVVYLDMEMTEDDLEERLTDLGYGPEADLSRLHYYLLPTLPPLDSHHGGKALAAIVDRHGADFVIIDTISRVVQGEENDADTFRNFYNCTGLLMKQRGVSVLRLDHGGKDPTKGQRGSSAKGDDVDIVWKLEPRDQNKLTLRRERARMSWIPEKVQLVRQAEPLRHVVDGSPDYLPGTKDLAERFDSLGFKVSDSAPTIIKLLRALGEQSPHKAKVLDAQRWRRQIADALILGEA